MAFRGIITTGTAIWEIFTSIARTAREVAIAEGGLSHITLHYWLIHSVCEEQTTTLHRTCLIHRCWVLFYEYKIMININMHIHVSMRIIHIINQDQAPTRGRCGLFSTFYLTYL